MEKIAEDLRKMNNVEVLNIVPLPHHEPLIPTQEELDAEHVGPSEMYLGDFPIAHVETDEEYHKRVATIEGEPEVEVLKLEDVLPQARIDTYVDQGFIETELVQYTDPAGDTFELPMIKESEMPAAVTQMPQEIMDALMNAPEMDVSKVDMSKVTSVNAPDPTTLFRNESAASFDDIVNDLSEIENVVEVVETKTELPSGFEWLLGDDIEESDEIINEGLEIPDNLKELASKIETRMQELYGCIKPYNYKETSKYCVVTINNTNEVFYI